MRKILFTLLVAVAVLATSVVPASATRTSSRNIVEVVVAISGPSGTDRNLNDYDILREALVATGLADAVATTDDITVFAPNDRAFLVLARDLGYDGFSEAEALGFLVEATGFVSADEPGLLDDFLLYHVLPDANTIQYLRHAGPVETLLGETLQVRGYRVIDQDPDFRDAQLRWPRNFNASNGIIQGVSRVLRPIDLAVPAPVLPSAAEVIIGASGASGTDYNWFDYDLLREALVATGLIDAVNASTDVTIFAPNDFAFILLARDLGYRGFSESGALDFLIEATGFVSAADPGLLDDVLLYHVAPGAQTVNELRHAGPIATLQGGTLEVNGYRVIDADPNDYDAWLWGYRVNIQTSNGIIQPVTGVLRPIDL